MLIDDSAPMTGLEKGGQGGAEDDYSDLIGKCSIPLKDLAKGMNIDGSFKIEGPKGEARGKLDLAITIVLPKSLTDKKSTKAQGELLVQKELKYTAAWEQDVIMKIARKLSKLSLEVDLLFGVFSRGQKSCTKEDFKYCCLQRLGLKTELAEKELDQLFESNPKLRDGYNLTQQVFVEIFTDAIIKARDAALNQEALDRSMISRFHNEGMVDHQQPHAH